MLRTQEARGQEITCVATKARRIEELLGREWILTNERGSFTSSTVAGCNTSGYHGLLVGSPDPLVNRVMVLSSCLETVLWDGRALELSTFEFPGRFAPTGHMHLWEFRRDIGARFLFRLEPVDLSRAIYLARDSDTVAIEYTFAAVREAVDFILRPFVGLRDFHALQSSDAPLACEPGSEGATVRHEAMPGLQLLLGCPQMRFESDPQWWYDFLYRVNRDRGLPCTEDLWAPGFFRGRVCEPGRVVFSASLRDDRNRRDPRPPDVDSIKRDLLLRQEQLIRLAGAGDRTSRILCLAADQFVAKRGVPNASFRVGSPRRKRIGPDAPRPRGPRQRTTIVAGFPWFADWGRDALISLPGLLLATGRYDQAKSVLSTFAAAVEEGMVPNRFDDRTGEAHFNSVDASLWFINAAFEYLQQTADRETFTRELFPAIRSIIAFYHVGTRFGIHADSDGLITAGDPGTQLTWMDAKCDGIAFTPRYGKAVEVNALWYSALRRMQRFCEQQDSPDVRWYDAVAEKVGRSFCERFWNEQRGYLNDTVMPDGSVDARLRPNQIFAVSLPDGPPLTRAQQRAVVDIVERELLTPYGLRTLNRQDPSYKGRYEGPLRRRDEAYHQGTVWPYLIGPFAQAYLKVHGDSLQARQKIAELLQPLLRHLTDEGCLGSVAELFDGDPDPQTHPFASGSPTPHRPGGCPAQAWSVAELLRAYRMVTKTT